MGQKYLYQVNFATYFWETSAKLRSHDLRTLFCFALRFVCYVRFCLVLHLLALGAEVWLLRASFHYFIACVCREPFEDKAGRAVMPGGFDSVAACGMNRCRSQMGCGH